MSCTRVPVSRVDMHFIIVIYIIVGHATANDMRSATQLSVRLHPLCAVDPPSLNISLTDESDDDT